MTNRRSWAFQAFITTFTLTSPFQIHRRLSAHPPVDAADEIRPGDDHRLRDDLPVLHYSRDYGGEYSEDAGPEGR